MNNKLIFAIGFAGGAAAGVAASWRILKAHYKKIAEEEIASVKEVFSAKNLATSEKDAQAEEEPSNNLSIEEKAKLMTAYSEITKKYDKSDVATVPTTHPYTISPEEFGERGDYDTVTLSYFADGVLADYTTDEVVEDVDNTVGTDSLTTFGQYEPDSVFVRNDATKTDYEILADTRRYTEVKFPVYNGAEE